MSAFEFAMKKLTPEQIKLLKNFRSDNRPGKNLSLAHEVHQFLSENPNGNFIMVDKDNRMIQLKNSDVRVILPKEEVPPSTITMTFSFTETKDQS